MTTTHHLATRAPMAIDLATFNSAQGYSIISGQQFATFIVRPVEDFNGDGVPDLLVASPNNPSAGSTNAAGRAYVVYGQTGSGSTIDLGVNDPAQKTTLVGPSSNSRLGTSLDSLDFNNDGLSDIIVATPGRNLIYVIYGQNGGYPNDVITATFTSGATGFTITSSAGNIAQQV